MNKGDKENLKKDLVQSTKQTATLFVLQLKQILSSPTLLFMVFIFPVLLSVGVGIIVPIRSLFIPAFGLVQLLIIGIIYGNVKYTITKDTLKKNMSIAVIDQTQTFISIIVTLFFFSFISYHLELAFVILMESNDWIFMHGFIFQGESSTSSQDVIWTDISWSGLYQYYIATFLLTTSTYYVADSFFKSYRTFCIFVFLWFIINLIFGGVMSSIWTYYDANSGYMISRTKLVEGWTEASYEDAIDWSASSFVIKNWQSYVPIIVPQWFSNQHFYYVFGSGAKYLDTDMVMNENGISNLVPANYQFLYWSPVDNLWNYSIVAPYLYTIFFSFVGLTIKRKEP